VLVGAALIVLIVIADAVRGLSATSSQHPLSHEKLPAHELVVQRSGWPREIVLGWSRRHAEAGARVPVRFGLPASPRVSRFAFDRSCGFHSRRSMYGRGEGQA
jgi:hypothetical protein